ncbi:MAG TPA: TolC family protein [Planctomycetota bacterium]|jgi:outer membrane protein TolC|nr:TolC family protein [Planctomycetota bacterium]
MNRRGLLVAVALIGACTSYESRPIRPAATEAEFRNRALSDPGLIAYLASRIPNRPPAWTVDTLTLVAFYDHPELDVARARVGLAEAGVVRAGARPNPSVALSPGLSTNAPAGTRPWILGFAFDVPVETAGKRGVRIEQAERLAEAARFDLGQTAWEIRSRVRAALAAHLLAIRELELLRGEASVRSEAAGLIEKKRAAGEVPRPEVDAAEIELATARLAIPFLEGRVTETRAALASAVGVPSAALEGASFAWPDLERPPEENALPLLSLQREGLLNRLDVQKGLAEYGAAEAALALEVARQYPDLHLGPGYVWDEGEHKFSLGLAVTLPLLDQNQGSIAEAEARRRESEARFRALQARVIGEAEQALVRYRAALAELREADDLATRLEAREQAMRKAVQLGEEESLAVVGIRVQRAAAGRARLTALARAQAALGALEDGVERPLAPPGTLPEPPSPGSRLTGER